MTITQDYYIVAVDAEFHSEKTKAGVITLNTAYADLEDMDSNQHRKTFGTVMACPETFSKTVVGLEDPGTPHYDVYVGGEYIEAKGRQGYTRLPHYYPSTFEEYEIKTLKDWGAAVDIRKGDKVYFDYTVIETEHLLGKHGNKLMYKVRVDQVYCSVRRELKDVEWVCWTNNIYMQGGWLLADLDMETWDEITTPSGIFKKPEPEAKSLQAFVKESVKYEKGTHIVFLPMSDAMVKVEGREYACLHEDWVIATIPKK
jgi:hypothetical protein